MQPLEFRLEHFSVFTKALSPPPLQEHPVAPESFPHAFAELSRSLDEFVVVVPVMNEPWQSRSVQEGKRHIPPVKGRIRERVLRETRTLSALALAVRRFDCAARPGL